MTLELADGRGELFQWDTGRIIEFGEDAVSQAHFTSTEKVTDIPYTVEVKNGKAAIPDELLQVPGKLIVYAWVSDTNGGYTEVQVNFPVFARPKPSDYVYTPTDQMTLQTIQRQIGDLADLTTEAKDTLVAAINEVARTGGAGSMDLRVADGYIQYSTDGGSTWTNLIAVAELKGGKGDPGNKGDTGATGAPGKDGKDGTNGITPHIGDNGHWYLGENDTGKPSRGATGAKGDPGTPGTTGPAGAPGKDGHSPVVTATKTGKATTISVNGTAIATVEDGADGAPGKDGSPGAKGDKGETGPQGPKGDPGAAGAPGKDGTNGKDGADGKPGAPGADGVTPHIGDNGHWYLGSTDTGKPSRGEQGPGAEVFYIDLAGKYPSYTCPVAMADIKAAYEAGTELKCRFIMGMYIAVLPLFLPMPSLNTWLFSGAGALSAMGFPAQTMTIAIVNGTVQASDTRLASMDDIPTALKNPNALTIKIGGTTVTYDGSAAKTVTIADGTEVSY